MVGCIFFFEVFFKPDIVMFDRHMLAITYL